MIQVLANAVILQLLLRKTIDKRIGFSPALITGLVAALGMSFLAVLLVDAMGPAGVLVAAAITAVLLGSALSLIFRVEFMRAWLVGVIFVVINLAIAFIFSK